MTRISVIIAAHNAAAYIGRAILSALGQTGCSVEVLVVDDLSSDDTAVVVQNIAADDGRVRLIRAGTNQGPGFARNLALDAAQGEWIAVLDADDAFLPWRLSNLLEMAERMSADVVSDNLLVRPSSGVEQAHPMFSKNWIDGPKVLTLSDFVNGNFGRRDRERIAYGMMKPVIRRQALEKTGLRYEISRFAEDYILAVRLLAGQSRWIVHPDAGYEYTQRPDSMTMVSRASDIEAFIEAERRVLSEVRGGQDKATVALLERHLKTIEMGYAWSRFVTAVKARDVSRAASTWLESPSTMGHIAGEIVRHAPRMAERLARHRRAGDRQAA